MIVICVEPFKSPDDNCENDPEPKVGDIDTVTGQIRMYGSVYYTLKGYSENAFKADHFATLPDATADEMAEEEQFIYDQFSC